MMSFYSRRECIAAKIKSVREDNGLTQKQMAKAIGVADSTISNYETGYRSPDIQTLEKISEHFNIDLAELLCLKTEQTEQILKSELPDELKDLDIESIGAFKELKNSGIGPDEIKAILSLLKNPSKLKE